MSSTQLDIESIFALAAKVCSVCNGSRSRLNDDGSYSPCSCVYKESFLKYLGELKKYVSLSDTPLLDLLKQDRDLVIEFDSSKILYAHIKTALLRRKILTKTWKIMTPDEVISRSFSNELDQRKDLYSCDLLVITAIAFPFYEAAGKQHEYVIKTRQGLGKTTWICTQDLEALVSRSDLKSMTPELCKLFRSLKKIKLNKGMTTGLMKKKSEKTKEKNKEYLRMGDSISGVNRDLLEIGNPVEERIHSYR